MDNFEAMLPAVAEAVEGAAFLAFDCEMTGLFLERNRHTQLDDMAARYDKARPPSATSRWFFSLFFSSYH